MAGAHGKFAHGQFIVLASDCNLSLFRFSRLTEIERGTVLLLEHVGAFGLLGFRIFVSYPERPLHYSPCSPSQCHCA